MQPFPSKALLAAKIDYTFPDGDMPTIARRVTSVFKANQPSFQGGSQAQISLFSNDAVLDLESSYFRANLKIEISGSSTQTPLGQYTYGSIMPLLENGVEDLIKEFRVESYGRTELEKISNYHHVAHLKHQIESSKANDNVLNRMCLRGDCLSSAEAAAMVTNTPGDSGKTIIGVPVVFQLTGSGIFNSKRYFPLRVVSQLNLFFDLETATNAFHQCINYSTQNSDWVQPASSTVNTYNTVTNSAQVFTAAQGQQAPSTAVVYANPTTTKCFMDPGTGRLCPSNGQVDPSAANITISYTLSELEFVADTVILQPQMEAAILKSVESELGLPYWFPTYYFQIDPVISAQNFTQRIGKGVANASRVITKFQHSSWVNNQNEDMFASEPFGLSSYQYRLGTQYYPRDPVKSLLHAVIEADKAVNYAIARNPTPFGSIRRQIGDSLQVQGSANNTGAGQTGQQNAGAANASVTQCYLPSMACVPHEFRIGTSLMSSPDAIISGVNTNQGHQLELFFERYQAPSTLTVIPVCSSVNADEASSSIRVNKTRQPLTSDSTNSFVGGLPRQSRYSWASGDNINVCTMLEYTRALVIRPDYLIEIRE